MGRCGHPKASGKSLRRGEVRRARIDENERPWRDKGGQRPAQRGLAVDRLPDADLNGCRSRGNRQRAAVNASAKSTPRKIAEVAANRVFRGRESLCERRGQHPAVAAEALENLLLTFGGENRHEYARSRGTVSKIMHECA